MSAVIVAIATPTQNHKAQLTAACVSTCDKQAERDTCARGSEFQFGVEDATKRGHWEGMRLARVALVAAYSEQVAAVTRDDAMNCACAAVVRVPAGSVVLAVCPAPARASPAAAIAARVPPSLAPRVTDSVAPSMYLANGLTTLSTSTRCDARALLLASKLCDEIWLVPDPRDPLHPLTIVYASM